MYVMDREAGCALLTLLGVMAALFAGGCCGGLCLGFLVWGL